MSAVSPSTTARRGSSNPGRDTWAKRIVPRYRAAVPCAVRSAQPYAVRMTYDPRQPDPRNTPARPTAHTSALPLGARAAADLAGRSDRPRADLARGRSGASQGGPHRPRLDRRGDRADPRRTRRLLPQRDRAGRIDHRDAARLRAVGGRAVRHPHDRPLGARAPRTARPGRRVGCGGRRRHHPRRRPAREHDPGRGRFAHARCVLGRGASADRRGVRQGARRAI